MIRSLLLPALLLLPITGAVARQEPVDDPVFDAARPDPSPSGSAPMVVTSDTDAYCESLSRQIDRYGDALPQPVASLRAQGLHLCATGQVRGGINRLRRALLALHDPDEPDQDTDSGTER